MEKRDPLVPEADNELDDLKYKVAEDLGLRDDLAQRGWESMTTREVGKIGGNMVKLLVAKAERSMAQEEPKGSQTPRPDHDANTF